MVHRHSCAPHRARIEFLEPRCLLSDTVIQGVLPAAMDLPRINAILRRSPTGDPLSDPWAGSVVQAYFDSGTSGILLSQETAAALGIEATGTTYYDVGVAGSEAFGVSEPLYMSIANFLGMASSDPELSDFGFTTGPLQTEISLQPADDINGPLDIVGMPIFDGKVVVIDPRPLISGDIDYIHAFAYLPGTPYNPATDATDPGIPNTQHHIKLSYGSFDRFTFIDPPTDDGPTTSGNPFIGPDPVRRMDDPTFDDGTPPVTITLGSRTSNGSFLLDTGAQASFISQSEAAAVGVHYLAGTYGTDQPVLVDASGHEISNQFTIPVGGIGGTITAAGFYLDKLVLHTTEGDDLVFEGAPVLVVDVTVEDATTGQTLTLDGDLGLNFFVASMEVQDGLPGAAAAGAFDWITLDQPGATLGLAMGTYQTPTPVITDITPDTGVPGDFITSARQITISGTADLLTQVTLYRDGQELGTADAGLDGTWTYDYTATTLADGTYHFTATETSLFGQVSPPSSPTTVIVNTTAPTVTSVLVNDGNAQRSMVRTLTITFSEPVTLTNAITLLGRRGTSTAGIALSLQNPSGDGKTYVASFSGPTVIGQSLPDGKYTLAVNASGVRDLAGNAQLAGATLKFFRLFGDLDGNRQVTSTDLIAFRAALNQPTAYVWWVDWTTDGSINGNDYAQLRKRLQSRLLR